MRRTTKYVGLDVHQATTVAAVRAENGRVMARTVLPTEEEALIDFFRSMRGTIHVAFEEGTQAHWLHEILTPVVDRVVVCDRRGESRSGRKSDVLDAADLAAGLQRGGLRAVYHGGPERAALKELAATYLGLVKDTTRVKLRLKSVYRARSIRTKGKRLYTPSERASWLTKLKDGAARLRAETLFSELDVLEKLRPVVKAAMVAQARRDPAWRILKTIPQLGPVRVSLLLAIMQTPWRFRTKRNLWAYAGLAVVTRSTADYTWQEGRAVRRSRAPMTRGLNRNHNPMLKSIFKSAATAAARRTGALQDLYRDMLARGMREELARVTLARKIAAVTLQLWKKGERFDPKKLTLQAR